MNRCPNCRARTEEHTEHCRRCGMELALLRRTERAAEQWLQEAVRRLAAGEPSAAEQALQRARTLQPDPLAVQLIGFLRSRATGSD
ncbi:MULTISPECIES: hypothetical protein [unclassified Halorhodospira]|uniref:hypothetical protein n=1 Tax=unclassified Halorhodospira TaxID=2626748 RepID=UPI001EE93813|nr:MULTISPECIES: hypothetical protein [unclassified Halorhodospira]MCG5538316.1 hypothetical protein [Halorhodospira sp. 9622]MCG5540086.1 hypothetical protein [Halorhodospira sp. M39old]MCG5544894.1 hypothetical protein [Halorhodospira sp. M38]